MSKKIVCPAGLHEPYVGLQVKTVHQNGEKNDKFFTTTNYLSQCNNNKTKIQLAYASCCTMVYNNGSNWCIILFCYSNAIAKVYNSINVSYKAYLYR